MKAKEKKDKTQGFYRASNANERSDANCCLPIKSRCHECCSHIQKKASFSCTINHGANDMIPITGVIAQQKQSTKARID